MNTRLDRKITLCAFLLISYSLTASSAVKPNRKVASSLPAIWQDAGPREQLKALRVAELDALRLLAERVYGFELNSETRIYDLILADDELSQSITQTIKGITSTDSPEYLDDGIVQVTRALKLRQVLETISQRVTEKSLLFGRTITSSEIEKARVEHKDVVVDVMGNGALPGSPGMRKIRAKRAAEIDAYRKLAERLMGVSVTSSTTVKDHVLASDKIRACTAQFIKGAKPVAITYLADDSCEVVMQIKVSDIIRIIRKYSRKDGEPSSVEVNHEGTTFTETGRGAARSPGDGIATVALRASDDGALNNTYQEVEVIIRQLTGRGVIIE